MPKRSIRHEMLARRKCLAAADCLGWSLRIQQRLTERREFLAATTIALYSPILNEAFTEEVFRTARSAGKKVAYPRVHPGELEFVEVTSRKELEPGAFGVLEPTGAGTVPMTELDLLVVPGVAFDRQGHRLGYGKGFYDRALHDRRNNARLVGLGYGFQIVEVLPAEVHDVRMDLIVTEERIFDFGDMASPGSNASPYI